MKTGMIMGITGGILGLIIGLMLSGVALVAGSVGGAMGSSGAVAASSLIAILGLGLPISSIVGGSLSYRSPKAAVICMGVPALAYCGFAIFGGKGPDGSYAGAIGVFIIGLIMGIGALSVYRKLREAPSVELTV